MPQRFLLIPVVLRTGSAGAGIAPPHLSMLEQQDSLARSFLLGPSRRFASQQEL